MPQIKAWDEEYKSNRLVTGSDEPQNDFKRFYKYLRKTAKIQTEGLRVLDLGSGTGKNSLFLAELGAITHGLEISETAISIANIRAKEKAVAATFLRQSFGEIFPFKDNSFDLALDIMSSNSLNEAERVVYLAEVSRVLISGGYFFVRLLALDGDKNAKLLLKKNPGSEHGTYELPHIGITERVLSKEEFLDYYSPFFDIIKLEKKSGYAHVGGRIYKRQYWIGYLHKL